MLVNERHFTSDQKNVVSIRCYTVLDPFPWTSDVLTNVFVFGLPVLRELTVSFILVFSTCMLQSAGLMLLVCAFRFPNLF